MNRSKKQRRQRAATKYAKKLVAKAGTFAKDAPKRRRLRNLGEKLARDLKIKAHRAAKQLLKMRLPQTPETDYLPK